MFMGMKITQLLHDIECELSLYKKLISILRFRESVLYPKDHPFYESNVIIETRYFRRMERHGALLGQFCDIKYDRYKTLEFYINDLERLYRDTKEFRILLERSLINIDREIDSRKQNVITIPQ